MYRCILGIVLCAAFAGCGGAEGAANRPPTYPASGLVTYNGQPVADAQVVFIPQQQQGKGAFARTNAQGEYKLSTFGDEDGAVAGAYYVTITKMEIPPAPPALDQDDPNYKEPGPRETQRPTKYLIPKKYTQATSSKLTAEVKESENRFDFALTD